MIIRCLDLIMRVQVLNLVERDILLKKYEDNSVVVPKKHSFFSESRKCKKARPTYKIAVLL